MRYGEVTKGRFISRPNRFIANVELNGEILTVHVKNTGRCRELLVPGAAVYLEKSVNPGRKTPYSLVCVERGERLINMDSSAPNAAAFEAISGGLILPGMNSPAEFVRREVTFGASRFDLYFESGEQCGFIEVKGVTLEQGGVCRFPDAPTERGIKHIKELMTAAKSGYYAAILFVIQMKGVNYLEPNDVTHKSFGDALREAAAAGVGIFAYDCHVSPEEMTLADPVEIRL